MKKLITRSCEEIMTTVYKPIEFVIDGLLAQGLYILAGAPKVGKSWLALDMCLSIAKGEKIFRLYEITDEPAERLHFVIMSESIGNGLEEEIENFKNEHYDLKVVFIDTLQKVRNESSQATVLITKNCL
ncbi:Replicative DNA helicase [uncultured Ruminococcus sp.]|nr:Replicative DNA helicase [uncultured Ruminococcus sp.]